MGTKALAVLLAGVLCCPAATAADGQEAVETFVFVGERVSIEEAPDPCAETFRKTGELTCINMDSLYKTRYRVLQRIAGAYGGSDIEFMVADHYGIPPFARFRNALLFVALADDGPWLHKYQAIPLHLTVDGQWASCGDIGRQPHGKPSPHLKTLRFQREIAEEADLTPYMLESYGAGERPEWRIERGKVWCSQGILLEDVYGIVRNGVMRARGVPLPDWPGRAKQ